MLPDVISQSGALFLGSRLRRLAERMQADVAQLSQAAGLSVQPSQYALLVTLETAGPLTIADLTAAMKLAQPTVTRSVAKLEATGMVSVDRRHRDQRHKTVALTQAARDALLRARLAVWPGIEQAVRAILHSVHGPLLDQVSQIEAALDEKPLSQRAKALPKLSIVDFDDSLAPAFHDINAQWVEAMYQMEDADREVLLNARSKIIDPGGAILFVVAEGIGPIGTCALRKTGPDEYELTKMGVLEAARGLKAGELLLEATIERAKTMGARRLYLLSNRKSAAAIHLYEKFGFVHDEVIMREFGARYERCNVAMNYPL